MKWSVEDQVLALIACHKQMDLIKLKKLTSIDLLDLLHKIEKGITAKIVIPRGEGNFIWNDTPEAIITSLKYQNDIKKQLHDDISLICNEKSIFSKYEIIQEKELLWGPWIADIAPKEYQILKRNIEDEIKKKFNSKNT